MNLEEWIYSRHNINLDISNSVEDRMEKCIKDSFKELNIKMINLSTDYVFPRILKSSNDEGILIWDATYWNIFRQFLLGLISLNEAKSDNGRVVYNNMDEKKMQDEYKSYIAGCYAYFLALKVNEQKLAIMFAHYYRECSYKISIFPLGISLQEMQEYLEVAKLYLGVHERIHYIYKLDKSKKQEDFAGIPVILNNMKIIVKGMEEQTVQKNYLQSKDELIKNIDECFNDKKMIEELLCDTYAFNECFLFCRTALLGKYPKNEIMSKCFEAIRILTYFNSTLIALQLFWNKEEFDLLELREIQKKVTQRAYLSEMMGILQLHARGLNDFIEGASVTIKSFEDNFDLENILYCTFLSEEAKQYWIELIKHEKNNMDDKKFALLGWRVKNEN